MSDESDSSLSSSCSILPAKSSTGSSDNSIRSESKTPSSSEDESKDMTRPSKYTKTSDSAYTQETISGKISDSSDSESKHDFKESIVKTQYEIFNIIHDLNFCANLIEECHKANVCGYIVIIQGSRYALGEMEGTVEGINTIKNYLFTSCLLEPFICRAKFSTYELENSPKNIKFTQAYTCAKI